MSETHDYEIAVLQHQGRRPLITNADEPYELTIEDFKEHYEEVGMDFVSAESMKEAAWQMVPRWNNGSGQESPAFREANDARLATSFSAGDMLSVQRNDALEAVIYMSDGFQMIEVALV